MGNQVLKERFSAHEISVMPILVANLRRHATNVVKERGNCANSGNEISFSFSFLGRTVPGKRRKCRRNEKSLDPAILFFNAFQSPSNWSRQGASTCPGARNSAKGYGPQGRRFYVVLADSCHKGKRGSQRLSNHSKRNVSSWDVYLSKNMRNVRTKRTWTRQSSVDRIRWLSFVSSMTE